MEYYVVCAFGCIYHAPYVLATTKIIIKHTIMTSHSTLKKDNLRMHATIFHTMYIQLNLPLTLGYLGCGYF